MDYDELRKQYPVTSKYTYLMAASIGGMHTSVVEAINKWTTFRSTNGATNEEAFADVVITAKETVSKSIGCKSAEVAFGPNTSYNMNVLAMSLKSKKNEIITTTDEFPSTTMAWLHHGYKLVSVPSNEGKITAQDLLSKINDNTAAVVLSGIQFSTGLKSDLVTVGHELFKKDIPFIVNATQMIGGFSVPWNEAKISALTASCHKWLGANMGQSLLILRQDFLDKLEVKSLPLYGWFSQNEPWQLRNDVYDPAHPSAASVELGTPNFLTLSAITEAFNHYERMGSENVEKRILELSHYLACGLKDRGLKLVSYRSDNEQDPYHSGIVSFKMDDPSTIAAKLKERNIFINQRKDFLRVSPHVYNNREDIDKFLQAIDEIKN